MLNINSLLAIRTLMNKHVKYDTHIICRRCNDHSYNLKLKKCVSCHYGTSSKLK